jgi:hypothetical protein
MKKKHEKLTNASVAPGIDNDEELEQSATEQEVEQGDYTEVTTLTLDDLDD